VVLCFEIPKKIPIPRFHSALLYILLHLNGITTLPCQILMSEKHSVTYMTGH